MWFENSLILPGSSVHSAKTFKKFSDLGIKIYSDPLEKSIKSLENC